MTDEQLGESTDTGDIADEAAEERRSLTRPRRSAAVRRRPVHRARGGARRRLARGLRRVVLLDRERAGDGRSAVRSSVWTTGLDWILTIGVPTVAVFLIVLRRFSPDGIRRVGSLGVDQFASVAFSVSAVVWLTWLWRTSASRSQADVWIYSWVVWVEFFLMLAGVVLTVFAPLIPPFSRGLPGAGPRSPRTATRVPSAPSRRARLGRRDPRAKSTTTDAAASSPAPSAGRRTPRRRYAEPVYAVARHVAESERLGAARSRVTRSSRSTMLRRLGRRHRRVHAERQQAFWALAPEERDVVDESGIPIFRIGPTAWALVIEDRGEAFVVRHEDGRVGYLHDVSGVTRG